MTLKLYDTLTRAKRDFVPLDANNVRLYVCGPTVYDFAHIGNARPVIVFDVLFRLLRHLYGEAHVTYVRNITDVDDKINARAAERGIPIRELTEETYKNFTDDIAVLGCLPPTFEPRATDYVSNLGARVDMIRLIERLIANGNAYVAEGHVLFAVSTMPDYGRLSKRSLDEMIAGARVEVAPYKRDPMDFVLWKPSPQVAGSAEGATGKQNIALPGWDSPWGRGRPGWHIECSAMSAALLGETFDIHGGGIDLVFPHHENEIAQSRCAFHTNVMANFWMHNGFLQVEGEKMAKSAGNFVTIRELLGTAKFGGRQWSGEVLRLAMLKTHYRQPIDWTVKRLWDAEDQLVQWAFAIYDVLEPLNYPNLTQVSGGPDPDVLDALNDDLNTHLAITVISRLAREVSTKPERLPTLVASLHLLGVMPSKPDGLHPDSAVRLELVEKIGPLIEQRLNARKSRNFAESDRIRDELAKMGIVLRDAKDPKTGEPVTTWEIAR